MVDNLPETGGFAGVFCAFEPDWRIVFAACRPLFARPFDFGPKNANLNVWL